jgi:hypothetical protein
MVMAFYVFHPDINYARPISARDANRLYGDTDAGVTWGEPFVVEADSHGDAVDGAKRWIACWQDEDTNTVPDDLMLVERIVSPRKTFMILKVC